eukprot:COSAG06_NODE_838_length_12005_cov_473.630354_5_plen_92_part_00
MLTLAYVILLCAVCLLCFAAVTSVTSSRLAARPAWQQPSGAYFLLKNVQSSALQEIRSATTESIAKAENRAGLAEMVMMRSISLMRDNACM